MGIALLFLHAFAQSMYALGLSLSRRLQPFAMLNGLEDSRILVRLTDNPSSRAQQLSGTGLHSAENTAIGLTQPGALSPSNWRLSATEGKTKALAANHTACPQIADLKMGATQKQPCLNPTHPRRLRVLHRQPGKGPGNMVISGRMADVCAELERLVAREASHQNHFV